MDSRFSLQLALLLCGLLSAVSTASAQFKVSGSQILDKSGRLFIPVGANLNGSEWGWNDKTLPLADLVAKTWKLNTVRLNCRLPGIRPGKFPSYQDNNDEDAIIQAYTSRGVVVVLEAHNWTGSYPTPDELPALVAWHAERAKKYKSNPMVWFNVTNEPGGAGEASPEWLAMNKAVITAIRGAGNTNIVVCDGAAWGQDCGVWDDKMVKETNSAILTFGPKLARAAGGEFDNIVFSIHTYDQWRFGDDKLKDYIRRVQAKKLALMIGETGAPGEADKRRPAAETSYRVALPLGVGILAWHGQPGDDFALCTTKPGGLKAIDNPISPTNLNWHGTLLWNASQAWARRSGTLGR